MEATTTPKFTDPGMKRIADNSDLIRGTSLNRRQFARDTEGRVHYWHNSRHIGWFHLTAIGIDIQVDGQKLVSLQRTRINVAAAPGLLMEAAK